MRGSSIPFAVVLLVLIAGSCRAQEEPAAAAPPPPEVADGQVTERDCSAWELAECVPKNGICGRGKQISTREGADCAFTERLQKCMVPCEGENAHLGKPPKCKYEKSEWSECSSLTNEMERILTLKKGDPTLCDEVAVQKQACDAVAGGIAKDTREAGQRCEYTGGEWSECTVDQTRTLVMTKTAGPETCAPTKMKIKNCLDKQGLERCLFDQWGEWSECVEGRQTRSRNIVAGGDRCGHKTSKQRPCNM